MNRLLIIFFVFTAISMIQSCAAVNTVPKKRKDPLIGKIIKTETKEPTDFHSLIKNISSYDVIYLSEKHNNPEHHNIQQRIIMQLVENGLKPTLGFEFFAMENTPDLLNFIDSGKTSHPKKIEKIIEQDLRKKLGWDTRSDQMWQYYYNLLNIAKKENLQVAGIDLADTLKKRITHKGINNLTPIEKEQIYSTHLSNKAYKDYMFSIFKAAHCGMARGKIQSRLYDTWKARNDKMALSITQLSKHSKGPVIVIIGGGHTEYGLGVINRVSAVDNTIRQVNIALTEINREQSELSKYMQSLDLKGFKKNPRADFLWFTQRVSYSDPCMEFKDALQKMKNVSKE